MGHNTRDFVVAVGNHIPAWLARFLGPSSRVSQLARPIVNRLVEDAPTEVSVRSGLAAGGKLVILPLKEKFYWTGAYEIEVQRALSRILKPGDTFWDIGAHIGFFTLIASRLVGAKGRVHAFEPLGDSHTRLEQTLVLNGLHNVCVHHEAVAATIGRGILHSNDSSLMWTLRPEFSEPEGVEVSCTTIDDRARDIGIPSVIKIDVEGAEIDVLRGGADVLRGDERPSLIVEFTDDQMVEDARDLLSGYASDRLSGRHLLFVPMASPKQDQGRVSLSGSRARYRRRA